MKKQYIHTEAIHNMTAPREVVPVLIDLIKPSNVLDIGCGTGTWLKAFEENGLTDYTGVDGDYVERRELKIPAEKFIAKDLRTAWSLNRTFDLVLSLEVAEHLPEQSADVFVDVLSRHANVIVFSAAVPNQGGQHHINEQWPAYWQEKFARQGFYFHDVIRPLIWNNPGVDWWYRQNMFLLTKEVSNDKIQNVIHPECYNYHLNDLTQKNTAARTGQLGVKFSLSVLFRSVKLFLANKVGR